MKFDKLHDESVNTTDIVKNIADADIRIKRINQELSQALLGIREFYRDKTDRWITEPVLDENSGLVIKEGVAREILDQYNPEKQKDFYRHASIISKHTQSIPLMITYIFNNIQKIQSNQNLGSITSMIQTLPQPEQTGQKRGGLFDMFKFAKKENVLDPEMKLKMFIQDAFILYDNWNNFLSHHEAFVYDEEAEAGLSNLTTRIGMASIKKDMLWIFTTLIESRLAMVVSYVNWIYQQIIEERSERTIQAITHSQREFEKAHPDA